MAIDITAQYIEIDLPAWAGPRGGGAVPQACPSTEGGAQSIESI